MPEIRLLDSSVINLIAAGEVVERPASAVKELTENALDAGATRICVEISGGGMKLIRITDNGCGMDEANARQAFLKHATSKISAAEDLSRIRTLGFRGEALAAISAVSKVTLTTKRAEDTMGHQLYLEEGKIVSCDECGCSDGSTFTVRDLFFNTPARLKFMKSEPAEAGAVQSTVERLALSHPSVSFRLTVNGTERLQTPGNGDLTQTVFSIYGREFVQMLLPAEFTAGQIRVSGFVGKPVYSKANRSRQFFFLNGRWVRSNVFTSGLESAYHNKMLIGRMPCCVLFVTLPEDQADINVHPGKLDVKFADENAVAYAVRKAAEAAIAADNGIVAVEFTEKPIPKPAPAPTQIPPVSSISTRVFRPAPPEQKPEEKKPISAPTPSPSVPREKEPEKVKIAEKNGWTISVAPDKKTPEPEPLVFRDVVPRTPAVSAPPPVFFPTEAPKKAEPKTDLPLSPAVSPVAEPVLFQTETPFRLIGEVFRCYAVVERGDEVLFVDKHALHERMNFEKIRKSEVNSQILLRPMIVSLGRENNRILSENADFLSRFGFMVETFGDDLLVREIPALIDAEQAEPLLEQFAEALPLRKDETLLDRFYYDIACKASIRSGSETSEQELKELIGEYFRRADELQYCPHGRPIVFSVTKKSIEKQFRRVK